MEYIVLNGEYHKANQPILTIQNRGFKYGDGLFESMFATGGEIPLFNYHIDRLIKSMKILNMIVPIKFTTDKNKLKEEIIRLIIKNKNFLGSRIRLSVFRNEGGLYTPENNSVSYIVETKPLKNTKFVQNQIGLKVDVFQDFKKPLNKLSNIKSSNSLIYILASEFKKNNFLDDTLILNDNNYLIESTSSNLFICKDESIYTPSLLEGCVDGVMRRKIIILAKKNNFDIVYDCMLTEENLLQADEIFLTNAVSGIKWICAFKKRRYYNKIAKYMTYILNNDLFPTK